MSELNYEKIYNVLEWIAENRMFFLPPICSKAMHNDGQLKILFVGGGNERRDYHLEEGEELYYMVSGMMCLRIQEGGKFKELIIREGEMFLLPARVPHSPQRYLNSVGLVVQRLRLPHEKDGLKFFMGDSTETYFEKWFHFDELETDFKSVFRELIESQKQHVENISMLENPPFKPDFRTVLMKPFHLLNWVESNKEEINTKGFKSVFGENFQTEVKIFGNGSHTSLYENSETFFWQLEGSCVLKANGREHSLAKGSSILIKQNTAVNLIISDGSALMSITMDPTKANT